MKVVSRMIKTCLREQQCFYTDLLGDFHFHITRTLQHNQCTIVLHVTVRFPWQHDVGTLSRNNVNGRPIRSATKQCRVHHCYICNNVHVAFRND
jgi:hypothetical protein